MRRWLMLVLILSGTVFSCMLLWVLLVPPETKPNTQPTTTIDPDTPQLQRLATEVVVNRTKQILASNKPDQLAPFIRPGELTPKQVIEQLQSLEEEHGTPKEPRWLGAVDSLAHPVDTLVVDYPDRHQRLMDFMVDDSGEWRADMDAYLQLCLPPFTELLSGANEEGTVRVIATRDTYYNRLYSDDSAWVCYSLRADAKTEAIYGYCRTDSRIMNHLLKIEAKASAKVAGNSGSPSRKNQGFRLTLKIKRDPDSARNQFEITEVLSDTWSTPEKPLGETLGAD